MASALIAAERRIPHTRSWVRPATASTGPYGHRSVPTSDMLSTPPGRSTRAHSSKNARREAKWKAASTLITPSTVPSAIGSRHASPTSGAAFASRRRERPARSCHSVMLSATSVRGRATAEITRSCSPSPFPTSRTTPPFGSGAATVSTRRRQAVSASLSEPEPSHSPRFSHPRAGARKNSEPMLSYTRAAGFRPWRKNAATWRAFALVHLFDLIAILDQRYRQWLWLKEERSERPALRPAWPRRSLRWSQQRG